MDARNAFVWVDPDGRVYHIRDLETNHLISILRGIKHDVLERMYFLGHIGPRAPRGHYDESDWRGFYHLLPNMTYGRIANMETECMERGVCWDFDGDVSGARDMLFDKQTAKSAACTSCALSLVCADRKLTTTVCPMCHRCFAPMGKDIGDIIVAPNCPRKIKSEKVRWCDECAL